jgi:hypothetical protein
MMGYRIFNMSSGEEETSTEVHVFARAYRAAWRSIYATEPAGRHQVAALALDIDFGRRALVSMGTANASTAPTTRCAEPAFIPVNIPPGGRHGN